MDPKDEYFSSFEEIETIDKSIKCLLQKVKFRNWTPSSNFPQFAAVKIFPRKEEKYENEVKFLIKAGNSHRNIVQFYHAMVLPDTSYAIFMEFCDKGCLAGIILKRSHDLTVWTKSEVLSIFVIITEALSNLHDEQVNIAHRDIKPANIFVNQNNEIRIGDFGISKEIRVGSENTSLGTRGYMSPRLQKFFDAGIYKSRHIDPYKEDVWSTGKTLFEIATMNLEVVIGKTDKNIRVKAVTDMKNCGYHEDAIEIILSMLITNKDNRPTMAEVCNRFKNLTLDNFEIPGFDPYLIKPKESTNSTPVATICEGQKNETEESITIESYDNALVQENSLEIENIEEPIAPESYGHHSFQNNSLEIDSTLEPLDMQYEVQDNSLEIDNTESCEICNSRGIFTHICGKKTEIIRFISFINEMKKICNDDNDIICMECKGLFSKEFFFRCQKNHFDWQLINFR